MGGNVGGRVFLPTMPKLAPHHAPFSFTTLHPLSISPQHLLFHRHSEWFNSQIVHKSTPVKKPTTIRAFFDHILPPTSLHK